MVLTIWKASFILGTVAYKVINPTSINYCKSDYVYFCYMNIVLKRHNNDTTCELIEKNHLRKSNAQTDSSVMPPPRIYEEF